MENGLRENLISAGVDESAVAILEDQKVSAFFYLKYGHASFWTRLLVKEKVVNLCRTHEQIKSVKEKLVKENLVVCARL